jgi:hypothetical protein
MFLQTLNDGAFMLYSASRRTDMPTFYPDGIVDQVKCSQKLEGIVLWTKDIRNCVDHFGLASVLKIVPCIINFTIIGLAGTPWEPNVPPLAEQMDTLSEMGKRLPSGAIRWRFDPIIAMEGWRERFTGAKEVSANHPSAPLFRIHMFNSIAERGAGQAFVECGEESAQRLAVYFPRFP